MDMASRSTLVANLERQIDEVNVIQAIYSDQVEIHDEKNILSMDLDGLSAALEEKHHGDENWSVGNTSLSFGVHLMLPRIDDHQISQPPRKEEAEKQHEVTVRFTFPPNYPEECICGIDTHSKSFSSTRDRDQFNQDLKSFLEETSNGSECVLLALNYVEDHIFPFLKELTKGSSRAPNTVSVASPKSIRVRSWIRFNHLLTGNKSHVKERSMVAAAKDLGLTGYIIYGIPGLICVEGDEVDVGSFLSECRKIGKKPDVVTEDLIRGKVESFHGKARLREIPVSELESALDEQGLGDQRRRILGLV